MKRTDAWVELGRRVGDSEMSTYVVHMKFFDNLKSESERDELLVSR